ncbi:MAG: DUF4946 domain-containing protein [Candidatus Melainabacteria bacterium]|nr:DUF4946 domain-containing protein [Candidatus Melainabacteria bacterium]
MNLCRMSCLVLLAAHVVMSSANAADTEAPSLPPQSTASPIADGGRPFVVKLPSGWEVSELNAPRPNSGREMAGGRLRALKKDGEGMAVIELTYLSRTDAGQADIDSEFSTFVSTVKTEYESKGLKTSSTSPKKATLGALPSAEVEITVLGQNKELRQWFAMALGKKYVYALSYTGEKQYYDRFEPEFSKCRASLCME